MKVKYIVTGGAGLIGSNIIRRLNELGEERILVVDSLKQSEKWKNLLKLRFIDYLEKEQFLNEYSKLNSKIKTKFLIHLGACSSTIERDASYLIENNFEYTKTIANLSVKRDVKFLYASSAATYGDGSLGYDDESSIESLLPLNMYGYSKHLFDLYSLRTGLYKKIIGIKYFNVFGFGEFHKNEMKSLVLKGYEQIKKTNKIQLFKSYKPEYKDGEQKRDFLYITDAVKMTLHLLHNKVNSIFNLGRGKAETWNSLANSIFKALGKSPEIEYIEMPSSIKDKYQYFTMARMDKLFNSGYKEPFYTIEESVKDYVQLLEKSSV